MSTLDELMAEEMTRMEEASKTPAAQAREEAIRAATRLKAAQEDAARLAWEAEQKAARKAAREARDAYKAKHLANLSASTKP